MLLSTRCSPLPPLLFCFLFFWVNKTLVPESIRKFPPPQKKGCCGLRIEKGKEKGKKNAEIYMYTKKVFY